MSTKQARKSKRPRKFKLGQTVLISFTTEEQQRAFNTCLSGNPLKHRFYLQSGVITSLDAYKLDGYSYLSIDMEDDNIPYSIPTICLL